MSLTVALLLIVCISNAMLGLLVLLRNSRAASSRLFFAVTSFVCLWLASSYYTDNSSILAVNVIANKFSYFFAYLLVVCIALFSYQFPVGQKIPRYLQIVMTIMGLPMLLLSVTPLVAGTVSKDSGNLVFTNGPLLPLYVLLILVMLGMVIKNLSSRIAKGRERKQASIALFGLAGGILLGLTTNVFIPILTNNWESAKAGPLSSLFIVAMVSYAIVRHGLFNVRLATVRALAYMFTSVTLFALCGVGVFYVSSEVFGDTFTLHQEVLFISAGLLVAVLFQPVKKLFDRLTNWLFYRDAYNPQQVLNSLNRALVSTAELENLLTVTLRIITGNIKTESGFTTVYHDYTDGPVRIHTGIKRPDNNFKYLEQWVAKSRESVVVIDQLTNKDVKLRNAMAENRISVLVSLTASGGENRKYFGSIMLGPKRSGNAYNSQDVQLIETIVDGLVIAIQNALRFEEIKYLNRTLEQKVANATRHLRESNRKLKMLDETKDDFISMASHQLRTPLTSAKGYLSLVLDGDAGPLKSQQRKLLTQAYISSQRMVYLIADLLNVSRLRTGKFIIDPSPVNLAEVVADEVEQLTETAQARSLELSYTRPEHFPSLMLDDTKTRQVVMNFIDNAIYYTPAGGHIQLILNETPHAVELRVVDDGIGVPKAEQHHLFSKFFRAKNAQKARPDGTGLGLFMAKKIIVAQGGAIIFTSQESKGSTFGFVFPKNPTPKVMVDKE